MSDKILDVVKPGVVTGEDVQKVFAVAKQNEFAIPAVNVVGTNSINAVIESAKIVNSPVMIQFSNGGAIFYAGKGLSNENQKARCSKWSKACPLYGRRVWSTCYSSHRPCC